MARVLVTRQLPEGGLEPLARAGHEVVPPRADDTPYTGPELARAVAQGVDGIICVLTDRIGEEVLSAGDGHLRVVADVAVGYDNVDLDAAARHGVTICNTPGVLDETTADLAFLLALSAARLASTAERDLRAHAWPSWGIMQYLGQDVHGAVLGIVGYGRIGRAVARRAAGFGMEVLHHSRNPTGLPGEVDSLDALLRASDIVSLHVPLTDDTRRLIGARELALMKPTAILVNTARGPVVDEDALADALERGTLFAAGLDVYAHEPPTNERLLAAPRTVLLPHIGSASRPTRTRMTTLAAEAVCAVLAGRRPPNVVTA